MDKSYNQNGRQRSESINLTSTLDRKLRKIQKDKKHIKRQNDFVKESNSRMNDHHQLIYEISVLKQEKNELLQENSIIKKELNYFREEIEELKRLNTKHGKYIIYLENYTSDLKKEIIFWMKKPKKTHQTQPRQYEDDFQIKIDALKSSNKLKEMQLCSLKMSTPINKSRREKHQSKEKIHSNDKDYNKCTSCHFKSSLITKQYFAAKRQKSVQSCQRKNLNSLCQCHQKYLQKSKYFG